MNGVALRISAFQLQYITLDMKFILYLVKCHIHEIFLSKTVKLYIFHVILI